MRVLALALSATVAGATVAGMSGCAPSADPMLAGEWNTAPRADGADGAPPRNVYFKLYGQETIPDTVLNHPDQGQPTGKVVFGPGWNIPGASNSVTFKDVDCAVGGTDPEVRPICVIDVEVAATYAGGASAAESLHISVQHINAGGNLTGQPETRLHPGSDDSEKYKIKLEGCGRVRVTLSFREKTSATNPAGIQTKFRASVTNRYCERR